jgi:hypothetical protein
VLFSPFDNFIAELSGRPMVALPMFIIIKFLFYLPVLLA